MFIILIILRTNFPGRESYPCDAYRSCQYENLSMQYIIFFAIKMKISEETF